MAKKKTVKPEDGLKTVAVALGSALGKLAAKIGVTENAVSLPSKRAKKSIPGKPPATKKKSITNKPAAPKKKAATKRASLKKSSAKKA